MCFFLHGLMQVEEMLISAWCATNHVTVLTTSWAVHIQWTHHQPVTRCGLLRQFSARIAPWTWHHLNICVNYIMWSSSGSPHDVPHLPSIIYIYEKSTVRLASVGLAQACPNYVCVCIHVTICSIKHLDKVTSILACNSLYTYYYSYIGSSLQFCHLQY